jgi:hypothetical protein
VRGVTRPRTLKGASLASLRRLSTKCPTSAFLISVPQSHKSRKSSRARFSTLFSCAIRRAALAWYCAIKNVHFRWYYTCACHDRWTTERENSDFGRYCVGKSCTSILMLIAVTRRSKKGTGRKMGLKRRR